MIPQPQNTQPATIPAPMAGMVSESSLLEMGAADAIYSFNMISGEYGLQVREGYESASDAIPVSGNSQVRTVIGFRGTKDDGSRHRLFAVTSLGIYEAAGSVLVQGFSSTSGLAGYGVYTTYTTIAGSYLFYADEVNGLFRYSEASQTWRCVRRHNHRSRRSVEESHLVHCPWLLGGLLPSHWTDFWSTDGV